LFNKAADPLTEDNIRVLPGAPLTAQKGCFRLTRLQIRAGAGAAEKPFRKFTYRRPATHHFESNSVSLNVVLNGY
jgi:hypothetical protein